MNNTIKSREFASILVTLICVKMLFTYPRLIMEKCENGAWLSVLVWGLAAAGVYYLTQKMYLKTGCISILAQSEAIGGKPLKMLTGLAVMALLIANMAPLVRAFPEAIKTALLQKSSMAVIATLLTVGVVVGAYNGVCALGRVASIFLPVAAAFILGFFVILIPFYDVNNLFPAAVAKNLTAGSASLSVFSDIFAANLLLPYISGSRCVKSAGLYAVFISIISSAAILLAYCLTYSPILYRKSGVLSIRLQKCTQNRRRRQQNSRNRAGEILLPRGADAVACAAHSCNRRHRQCHLADHTPRPPSAELRRFISPLRRRINSASTSNFDSG